MSYTVLARKYRSKTFDEIVGQDAIATTLKNAIASDRVHHGYLFTGTRGVGKTSMARILAKALNCLSSDQPVTVPCCSCDSCTAIAEGGDIDVIEIDAASNTGVDNIRELRSNANYRPARSRFKVCIIDEVHMLSTGAFNALLKTLEEPPAHVKFIFATTEAQKIPATVLSRVQRFDFRPIGTDVIADHLVHILEQEGIEAESAVIRRVSRLANGSIRDALSLLDQLLSLGNTTLTSDLVDEILPAAHSESLGRLIDCIADTDAAGALRTVEETLGRGDTLIYFCNSLINQLRTLMLMAVCGEDTELVDVPAGLRQVLVRQSKRFDAATYVYMITVMEELRRNVRFSGSGRALTDAAIVKLCEAEKFSSIDTLLARLDGKTEDPPTEGTASRSSDRPTKKKVNDRSGLTRDASATTPNGAIRKSGSQQLPGTQTGKGPTLEKPSLARGQTGEDAPPTPQAGSTPQAAKPVALSGKPKEPLPGTRRFGGPSRQDKQAALNDPAVRQAIDLFQGELVNVERVIRQEPPQVSEQDGNGEED